MAMQQPDPLSTTFAALADPTRRAILARLANGEASVKDLSAPFDMSQPAISKHLRVLERAGLIEQARQAQQAACWRVGHHSSLNGLDLGPRCVQVEPNRFGQGLGQLIEPFDALARIKVAAKQDFHGTRQQACAALMGPLSHTAAAKRR